MSEPHLTRRSFLRRSAAAAAAVAAGPTIIPARALGREGRVAPSERIVIGGIGMGGQGSHDLMQLLWDRNVQAVAVCDVDRRRRDEAVGNVNRHYRQRDGVEVDCAGYTDYRELLARGDLNAVVIGTPDHWHAIQAIDACRAGCDVYCEKPLSLTIGEARAMVEAVRRHGRVLQTGSQQRSGYDGRFRIACEYVRSGRIGELREIYIGVGGPSRLCDLPAQPTPEHLDWDLWLGPAPWRPYHEGLHPYQWRSYRDYSGGGMTDWGAHHFDIAQWGMDTDHTGPVEIIPPGDGVERLTFVYESGVRMYHGNSPGVTFVGSEGKIDVARHMLTSEPASILQRPLGPGDVHLYRSPGHGADWLEAIRTRRRPICDVEIGARSVTICHLGNIAYWLGRPLRWNPDTWQIEGDAEAARWIDRPKRSPWRL